MIPKSFLIFLKVMLFFLYIYHPLYSVFISPCSEVCSPEHLLEWLFYSSSFWEFRIEILAFFECIRVEGDIDIVSLIYCESHRWRCVCPHELVSAEDRETDVRDHIASRFIEWRHIGWWGDISESSDRWLEFSTEDGSIELERFLSLGREVQVGGSIGHRGFGLGSMSFYFLLLRSYFMDEWSH